MKTLRYGAAPAVAAMMTAMAGLAGPARAVIPANAPYNTDPQNLYVQDDTSQGISSLNTVLCVVGSMDPGDMVNAGPYLALVDMNKCQARGGSNSSGAGATNYANAIVDVTRADNSSPMVARVWLSMTDQGNAISVWAHLTATQSPSAGAPYGVFRMDYIGKKNNQTGFNGYIDAQPGVISFLETGPNSNNTALAMSAATTSSGSGTMSVGGSTTFNFAYNTGFFRRSDGTNDVCFDRSRANASISVWRYGTYNANDGTRVDQAHPGFPIQAQYQGASYYGFANYWGINFQGLAIPDGQPVAGLTVSDQRPGNTTTYALSKLGGKLTRWTQASTTLGALDGIPLNVGADLTSRTTGNAAVTGWNNWVVKWNSTAASFAVIGTQSCGSNGCVTNAISPPATVNAGVFDAIAISGWADSYGGNINIPPTSGAAHAAGDPVYYYTQTTVIPGSASLPPLYCLSQCPTAASLLAFPGGGSGASPFGNGTGTQWFSASSQANTVMYSFGPNGLTESGSPVVLELASSYPSGSQYAQNGIQTGRLFTTALSGASCPAGSPAGTVCEPSSPATYYTWQTGPQQWNQSLWLSTGAAAVSFDPPQNIPYTVPAGAAYGSYSGLPILLQFNGFGNLFGIPGSCVSPVDNSPVDCSVPNSRYVPSFSIPDGATMSLPNPATPLIVKALDGEIRLSTTGASNCSGMALTPLTLPSGGTHDPSSASDVYSIGPAPSVTAAPKVIDGVVQP